MKIKYLTLLDSIDAFRQLNSLGFMPRTALDLTKISQELDKHLVPYEKQRQELEDSLRTEENTVDGALYEAGLEDIQAQEFEVDISEYSCIKDGKLPFSLIERTNSVICPNMLLSLSWFIDLEEKKPEIQKTTPKKR